MSEEEKQEKDIKLHKKLIAVYSFCLIIWIGKIVLEIACQDYVTHPKIFIADIVLLIIYIIALILRILSYREKRTEYRRKR